MLVLAGWAGAARAEDRKPQPQPPPPPAKQPAVRATVESKRALAATSLTADAVVAKIEAAYIAQLRRCYGELIARSPGKQGKVALSFEVTPRGETAAVRVLGLEARLEACLAGQVAAWQFAAPRTPEGGPTAARFEVTYRLQPEPDRAMLLQEEAQRFADMLTSGDNATATGDMSKRRPGAGLDSQIAAVREGSKGVAIGGGGGRGTRTGQGGGAGPKIDGPTVGAGDGGAKVTAGPPGRVMIASKQALGATSLDENVVTAKVVSAYMAGIKRCYKQLLSQDPTARGKVALAFEVTESGRAQNGKATSFEASLGSCLQGLLATWRFPVPKDADGDPTSASFRLELQLVPE